MTSSLPELDWNELDDRAVDTVRVLAMDAVQKANSGHPGTAMALGPDVEPVAVGTVRIVVGAVLLVACGAPIRQIRPQPVQRPNVGRRRPVIIPRRVPFDDRGHASVILRVESGRLRVRHGPEDALAGRYGHESRGLHRLLAVQRRDVAREAEPRQRVRRHREPVRRLRHEPEHAVRRRQAARSVPGPAAAVLRARAPQGAGCHARRSTPSQERTRCSWTAARC